MPKHCKHKMYINIPIAICIQIPIEEQELLGSVTTLSSPAVRTSARVIQKMKLDLIRPTSPPPAEKKGLYQYTSQK